MALQQLERYLFQLKSNPKLRIELAKDPEAHLAGFDLAPDERAALRNKDLVTLWRMGVHPLLLVPFSQAVGIPPADYQRTLAPLRGERTFKS
jgi:hypothetical protein